MPRADLRKLKDRAAEAARAGQLPKALSLLAELERAEPKEPAWPRRKADLYRRLGDRDAELAALVRAAELYAAAGFAVQAIATCKLILSLDPGHMATQARLDQLVSQRGSPLPTAMLRPSAKLAAPEDDAPLDELMLTEIVSDAQAVPLADEGEGGVAVIPLDSNESAGELDLGLTQTGLHLMPVDAPAPEPSAPPRTEVMLGERPPVEELARTPLFGALDSRALAKLIGRVRVVDVAAGETLFRQGDPADSLYVVADGAVVPIAESPKGRTRLGVLEPGSFFGEIGLVTNQPRNATIEALVATRLLEIRRTAIWELVREQPEVFKVMLRFLRERLVDRLVRTSPLFRVFERAERSQVARQFRFLEVKDGTVVIEQKRPSPSLFVLLAGHLDVILMDTDGDKQLARLKPGDVCGERSMLLGEPAMAAVVASGKCWLLALDADRFARILERNPKLQQVIERVCEARSRANDSTFRKALRAGEGDLGLI